MTISERRKEIRSRMRSLRNGMPSGTALFLMSDAMQAKYEAMADEYFKLEKELERYVGRKGTDEIPTSAVL